MMADGRWQTASGMVPGFLEKVDLQWWEEGSGRWAAGTGTE